MAIGQLVVKIVGDSSQLGADLSEAGKKTDSFAAKGRESLNTFGKTAVGAFGAAAAALATLTIRTADQIRELDALAGVANTTVAEFQRIAYGAKTVGIEQDKLADILKDVNDRVGDFNATGGGPMADFFEKIAPRVGVTAAQFKNLSGPQALQLYVDSLQKANLSQADMTFYMEAMASDSTRLIPLLRDGGAAMAELAAEAEDLGIGLSAIDVAKVNAANAEIGKIGAIAGAASQSLTVELMPVFGAIADEIVEMVQEMGGFGAITGRVMDYSVKAVGVFADGFRGIQVIAKGLELGFEAFAFAVNRVFLATSRNIDRLVNGAIGSINILIDGLNSIPGVGIDAIEAFVNPATQLFTENTQYWKDAMAETLQEMHELAMKPLPSEGIEQWVNEVQAIAQRAAEAVAAAQQGITPTDGGEATPGMSEDEIKALDARVEKIRQSLMTEHELKLEQYALDQEALLLALENERITREEYDMLALERAQVHADELTDIDARAAEARIALMEAERAQKFAMAKTIFGGLADLMNTGSRKMFEIGKAAALANAGVSGVESAVLAWEAGMATGGPWAPAVAAAYTAASLAKTGALISQISGASFGQKTAPTSFSGGVPTVPTSQPGGGGGSGFGGTGRNVSISLVGDTFSRDQVRGLIDAFNTEINDGYKLTVTGG